MSRSRSPLRRRRRTDCRGPCDLHRRVRSPDRQREPAVHPRGERGVVLRAQPAVRVVARLRRLRAMPRSRSVSLQRARMIGALSKSRPPVGEVRPGRVHPTVLGLATDNGRSCPGSPQRQLPPSRGRALDGNSPVRRGRATRHRSGDRPSGRARRVPLRPACRWAGWAAGRFLGSRAVSGWRCELDPDKR